MPTSLPDATPGAKPKPRPAPSAAQGVLLACLLTAFGIAYAVNLAASPETPEIRSRPWVLDAMPFTERDALIGCGRRGVAIAACLDSEAALRPRAQALWAIRPVEVRRACLRQVGSVEQAGRLYACLAVMETAGPR